MGRRPRRGVRPRSPEGGAATARRPRTCRPPGSRRREEQLPRGYRRWAPTYDQPNSRFALDEPFVDAVLETIPAGIAIDAACATGRLTHRLHPHGHHVIGVDSSAEMLQVARRREPQARFVLGDLHRLPIDDSSTDVVVCALALSHLPSSSPVMAEFARVLRPGGNLVVSDVHHELVFRGSVISAPSRDGRPGLVPTFRHTPGSYLRAALAHGLVVRRCEEPRSNAPAASVPQDRPLDPGPWEDWPWSLLDLLPAAADAAWDVPLVIAWHFQKTGAA